jgi:hypothetical protein
MANSNNKLSDYSQEQILQKVYDPSAVLAVGSFLSKEVGNQITFSAINSTTEAYTFYEGSNLLYVLTIVYTDNTKAQFATVTRTV